MVAALVWGGQRKKFIVFLPSVSVQGEIVYLSLSDPVDHQAHGKIVMLDTFGSFLDKVGDLLWCLLSRLYGSWL